MKAHLRASLIIAAMVLMSNPVKAANANPGSSATQGNDTPQARAAAWLTNYMVAAGRTRGEAPVRRALLVGINTYEPTFAETQKLAAAKKSKKSGRGNFQDLDGCVNDVEEMRALLIARFGFRAGDILMLTNRQATREAILSGIRQQLAAASKPGDVAFFFYAGHGSQVVNSKSQEPDKRDETIVPADSWTGVPDIRDKELRPLFNTVLDKGVLLTAIFDSCHSGSAARGAPAPAKSRHAEPIADDIADATDYGASPEERGALILAAAQDDQAAEEQREGEINHGAFTVALLKVLRTIPVTRSATEMFLAIKSTLQSGGRAQEPVLAGSDLRRKMGLFGGGDGLSGRIAVAALGVNPEGEVTLQGGRAVGLGEGCQLIRPAADTNKAPVRLEVTSVAGLTLARAKVIEGSASDVVVSDVFEVSRWTTRPEAMLRVWLPTADVSANQIQAVTSLADDLRKSGSVKWIDDPAREIPSHVISWNGTNWSVSGTNGATGWFTDRTTATQLSLMFSNAPAIPEVFLSLPLSTELKQELKLGAGTENDGVEIVASPADANYLLAVAYREGKVRYAWTLPTAVEEQAGELPLPVRTWWFPTNGQPDSSEKAIARQLEDAALRIGKVKSWLTLESPADDGGFPYRLALSNATTGLLVTGDTMREEISSDSGRKQLSASMPVARGGERFSLSLHADAEALKQGCGQRYVYVFTLDSAGRSQLLWPRGGQGNSQRFPPPPVGGSAYPTDIPINVKFSVGPPYGIDTYVMLASLTAIPDASVLEFDGVRGSGTRGGGESNPLQKLLRSVGSGTRGAAVEAPADWSIQRISVRSVPR